MQIKTERAAERGLAKLPDEVLEVVAARFRVLGEPSRLKLIRALLTGERTVTQLVAATELSQANASRHLQMLTDSGILARRKEGLNVIYWVGDPGIGELCQQVCDGVLQRHAQQAEALKPMTRFTPRPPSGPASSRGAASALAQPSFAQPTMGEPTAEPESFRVSFD